MTKQIFFRSIWSSPLIVCGLLLLATFSIQPAFSQALTAEPDGRVLVSPLFQTAIPYVVEALLTALFALAAVVASWMKKKWNIDMEAKLKQIEASHRDALHSAVKTAVSKLASSGKDLSVNVGSESLAQIIRYLRDSVPDALEFFKPSDQVLSGLAMAKAAELLPPVLPLIDFTPSGGTSGLVSGK